MRWDSDPISTMKFRKTVFFLLESRSLSVSSDDTYCEMHCISVFHYYIKSNGCDHTMRFSAEQGSSSYSAVGNNDIPSIKRRRAMQAIRMFMSKKGWNKFLVWQYIKCFFPFFKAYWRPQRTWTISTWFFLASYFDWHGFAVQFYRFIAERITITSYESR